jgi:hypothetical protein
VLHDVPSSQPSSRTPNQPALPSAHQPTPVTPPPLRLPPQFYSSGVYQGGALAPIIMLNRQRASSVCSVADMSHTVLITGYNTTATTPYLTIKNSFGASWGQGGMGRILLGSDYTGTCGIYAVSWGGWKA